MKRLHMKRTPEPEIMGEDAEAKVYELADFSEVNQAFAERAVEMMPHPYGVLIDLGCGPGDILVRICELARTFMFLGLDGSKTMLNLAQERIKIEALDNSIHLIQGDAKALNFPGDCFDLVISNSLVHHLPDPVPFWREIHRVCKPGGIILVQDLSRPDTPEEARRIVERESGSEPQLLKDLFFYSLLASFTPAEVEEHLATAGLTGVTVRMSSDRHWEVAGESTKKGRVAP
jgi:ubiquinone/menaquinone biosynthesis C-methylase UbiE